MQNLEEIAMAAGVLKGFWQFLNTDIKELPWGEVAKTGAESAKTAQRGKRGNVTSGRLMKQI